MNDPQQVTALVTGANRGLGRRFAEDLVARGATVYAAARRPETIDVPGVIPIQLDITDRESVRRAAETAGDVTVLADVEQVVRECVTHYGRVDILVNDAAVLAHKPYVWGSIYRFEGQVSVFWEDAPDGLGLNYRDLYPEPPPPGMVPSCAEGGVLGILCASIASVMGTEAIKLITGIGEPLLGRLMVYDALDMTYRTIKIRKDPATPKITELIDYEAFCGVVSEAAADAAAGATVTPRELREMIDTGRNVALIDVREPVEWEINHIEGAELIPKSTLEAGDGLAKLPQDRVAVLYCKTGVRSAEALAAVKKAGFSDALHLQGGIVAWAKQLEPDMVMY